MRPNKKIITQQGEHCSAGFVSTSTNGARDVALVGNIIRDIRGNYAVPNARDPWNGAAIRHMASFGLNNYLVDNTCYDTEDGIVIQNLSNENACAIHGNIISNRTKASGYDLEIEQNMSYASIDYNFYPADTRIHWGNQIYSLAQLQANTINEDHGITGNPLFINAPIGDLTLQSASPAKNSSVEGSIYQRFNSIYGLSIKVDQQTGARPVGIWDRGALEFGSSPIINIPVPVSPNNLRILN